MDLDQITHRLMGLSGRIRRTVHAADKAALQAEFDALLCRLNREQRAGVSWLAGAAERRPDAPELRAD